MKMIFAVEQKGESMNVNTECCNDCDRSIYEKYHDHDINIENDVKIKVIDSNKLIDAINKGSYDINLSAIMTLGAVILDTKKQESKIIRCKDCKHNHDCNIQYHAQAGEEFYCGAAEKRSE